MRILKYRLLNMIFLKYCLLFFLIFNFFYVSAQENKSPKDVYLYTSAQDFKNQKEKFIGRMYSFSWKSTNGGKISCFLGLDKKEVILKKYWGFRVGETLFRMKKTNPKVPLQIIGKKEKIFYLNGYFFLRKLTGGGTTSSKFINKNIFYSDDFFSNIYNIEKIVTKEKNNQSLKAFCACIKKGKKRYGYQAQFNGKSKCITSHLEAN